MDRLVDLDAAAAQIETRRQAWQQAGLTVGPVTWRDEAEPWPQTIRTDRSTVMDPDSVGVQLNYRSDLAATVVLYRGGWAEIDLVDFNTAVTLALAPTVPTPATFGEVLDNLLDRMRQAIGSI